MKNSSIRLRLRLKMKKVFRALLSYLKRAKRKSQRMLESGQGSTRVSVV